MQQRAAAHDLDLALYLVFLPGFVSNIQLFWERPEWTNFFSRLAGFRWCRLVIASHDC